MELRRMLGLWVGVVVIAVAGCSGDDDDGASPVEVESQVGEAIRDGFVVVEGSDLVGPAFPGSVAYLEDDVEVVDEGFRAMLVARDDPGPVLDG